MTYVPVEHYTTSQILELGWTLPPSFLVTMDFCRVLALNHSNCENPTSLRYHILKRNVMRPNVETVNYLEITVHAVFNRCWLSLCFLWVFIIFCHSPCEFAVAPQDAFVFNLGTLAQSRNNPSPTVSFCTAHVELNTWCFVFGLTVWTGLVSASRSPAVIFRNRSLHTPWHRS